MARQEDINIITPLNQDTEIPPQLIVVGSTKPFIFASNAPGQTSIKAMPTNQAFSTQLNDVNTISKRNQATLIPGVNQHVVGPRGIDSAPRMMPINYSNSYKWN